MIPDAPPNHVKLYALLRHVVTVLVMTFTLGGWVMSIQMDLTATKDQVRQLREKKDDDFKEWWTWRQDADGRLGKAGWDLSNHQNRINSHEERLKWVERNVEP